MFLLQILLLLRENVENKVSVKKTRICINRSPDIIKRSLPLKLIYTCNAFPVRIPKNNQNIFSDYIKKST